MILYRRTKQWISQICCYTFHSVIRSGNAVLMIFNVLASITHILLQFCALINIFFLFTALFILNPKTSFLHSLYLYYHKNRYYLFIKCLTKIKKTLFITYQRRVPVDFITIFCKIVFNTFWYFPRKNQIYIVKIL